MACVDFPTEEERVLLAEMKKTYDQNEDKKRLDTARIAILDRFRVDRAVKYEKLSKEELQYIDILHRGCNPEDALVYEALSEEEVETIKTLDLPKEETLFQGRMKLMYGSVRFKRSDDFGKAELLKKQLSTSARVAQPMHELVWKSRVSMIQETVRQYATTDQGYDKLRDMSQSGQKLREPGDWKSSTFDKDGNVKGLPTNKILGNHAENLAAAHLDKLLPNLNVEGVIENASGHGVDLIARDSQTGKLVAVEVKGQDMKSKAKRPHQLLKKNRKNVKQVSEEWLHNHILGMAMTKAADMVTSCPESSDFDLMSHADEAMGLEKELLTQEGGIEAYVIGAQAKEDGMSARISYRKGGEEKFKEITDKPQFMELDSVAPPETEEIDVSQFYEKSNWKNSVDGEEFQNQDEL